MPCPALACATACRSRHLRLRALSVIAGRLSRLLHPRLVAGVPPRRLRRSPAAAAAGSRSGAVDSPGGRRLDAAFAPSLAARLRLALAGIETVLGHIAAAAKELRQARALYPLAQSLAEKIERIWGEAKVAAAAGENDEAEVLLDRVRRELLARGSLIEAAQCSYEQLLIQVESRRFGPALQLAEDLALAFQPASEAGARELAYLVRLAIEEPEVCYQASNELRRRLRLRESANVGRPALLVPTRALADRLFCGCGELEDSIGAAGEL